VDGFVACPSHEALRAIGKGIQIRLDFAKAASNPALTAINATAVTNQPSVTGFQMQAAVPSYLKMQMQPASGTSMPPNVTQVIKLANSQHGAKPLQLRLKVIIFRPATLCIYITY
jgi:AP-1 complex subunit gamma-1